VLDYSLAGREFPIIQKGVVVNALGTGAARVAGTVGDEDHPLD
jgi:hypothetical protein